jgi:hypothetical protein
MRMRRLAWVGSFLALACALASPSSSLATGVPISGFFPLTGISLTDKFKDQNDPNGTFFLADPEPSLSGTQLGVGGTPHYDIALLDTGAATSLLTSASDAAFNITGAGFHGTETQQIGGANGFVNAAINNPLAIFATGLANRTNTSPLTLNPASFVGQSSVSLLTAPPQSDLPNVLGIPFSSQYATYIRNDQPQIFQSGGTTVRTPQIQFLPLGSGSQGLTHRAPITLDDPSGFSAPPLYIFNLGGIETGDPLTQNPTAPTVLQAPGAYFLSVNVNNKGQSLTNTNFFLDTGADVSVVSQLNAVRLGFDPTIDTPDFTVSVLGSGGTTANVPGFYADQFTIQAVGGSITLTHVPFIVLDVTNPAHPGNVVDGIIGMNALAGRNVVIDPKPSLGGGGAGPSLYISDPVTTQLNWTSTAASGTWATGGNWSTSAAPSTLGIANVRHVSGGNQTAVVAANATAWELNVSGTSGQKMTAEINSGVTLTTFSGANIEGDGIVQLDSATLDAQFIEIMGGGILRGTGTVTTGSGPIPGQVENRSGTVAPGNGVGKLSIIGRYAQASDATLAIDLGGTAAGSQYDQLAVTGGAVLSGALAVSLANLGGGIFSPSVGNAFTILTATDGLSGSFSSLSAPLGFNWYLKYISNNVQLIVGVPGDYNHDGIVNAADYTVWRDTLNSTTNLAADGSGNGIIDQADYTFWKSRVGATIGAGAGGGAAVPEPATQSLLIVAAVLLFGGHKGRAATAIPRRSAQCGAWPSNGSSSPS